MKWWFTREAVNQSCHGETSDAWRDLEQQIILMVEESQARMLLDAVEHVRDLTRAEILHLTADRDKWLAHFNRSEQFQNGPTTRAEVAEARVAELEAAIRESLRRFSAIQHALMESS